MGPKFEGPKERPADNISQLACRDEVKDAYKDLPAFHCHVMDWGLRKDRHGATAQQHEIERALMDLAVPLGGFEPHGHACTRQAGHG